MLIEQLINSDDIIEMINFRKMCTENLKFRTDLLAKF